MDFFIKSYYWRKQNMENNVLQQLKENIAKVMIGNEVYDAVSDTGAFIERGKVVRVVKYQDSQVYVVMS